MAVHTFKTINLFSMCGSLYNSETNLDIFPVIRKQWFITMMSLSGRSRVQGHSANLHAAMLRF